MYIKNLAPRPVLVWSHINVSLYMKSFLFFKGLSFILAHLLKCDNLGKTQQKQKCSGASTRPLQLHTQHAYIKSTEPIWLEKCIL